MSDKQPEALRLADNLERMVLSTPWDRAAAAELRRLHAANQGLVDALNEIVADARDWAKRNGVKPTWLDKSEAALAAAGVKP